MRSWMKDTAQAAEEAGVYSMWVMDHFFQLGGWLGDAEARMLEGYSTLGFLAGVTERVKLGLMVGGVIYRQPAITVKTISTLDVLSGGRMYFGIGAAWYEYESKSLGLPFPTMKERFELLEEQLQIAKQMFAGDKTPYHGKHTQMAMPHNNPQPLQKPHPPILIGGMGPTKTLRMVAQYADACNFFGGRSDEDIVESLDVLKGHCNDLGRNYDEIEKTLLQTLKRNDPTFDPVARAKQARAWGFTHIIFNVDGLYDAATLDVIAETVAALKDV